MGDEDDEPTFTVPAWLALTATVLSVGFGAWLLSAEIRAGRDPIVLAIGAGMILTPLRVFDPAEIIAAVFGRR